MGPVSLGKVYKKVNLKKKQIHFWEEGRKNITITGAKETGKLL